MRYDEMTVGWLMNGKDFPNMHFVCLWGQRQHGVGKDNRRF